MKRLAHIRKETGNPNGKIGAARDVAIAGVLDNLRGVFQVVHGYSKRAERAGSPTGPQFWAVRVLSESGPVRVSDLARRMRVRPSTVVGILDRPERRDLAERTRSREDRRVVTVKLARKGRRLVSRVPEGAHRVPPRFLHSSGVNFPEAPAPRPPG